MLPLLVLLTVGAAQCGGGWGGRSEAGAETTREQRAAGQQPPAPAGGGDGEPSDPGAGRSGATASPGVQEPATEPDDAGQPAASPQQEEVPAGGSEPRRMPVIVDDPGSREQRLLQDLLLCVRGETPSGAWRNPRMLDGHLQGGGRSANHGRLARAVQTCVAPEEEAGPSGLTALEWWTAIEAAERGALGHRYQEIAGGYEAWSGLAEAVVVWKTADADHPAARMLRRELLLFAVAAREIEHRSKWRALYVGHGRRVAGLRKLPWAWSFNIDSWFYARLLGLPETVDILPRKREMVLAEELVGRVRSVLAGEELDLLRRLALDPGSLAGDLDVLRRVADPLRAVQPYLLVRRLEDDATFSALLGPLAGRNTAPTRAVWTRGRLMTETDVVYPYRRRDGTPRRRVRGGDELSSGGGELLRLGDGSLVYRAWDGRRPESREGGTASPDAGDFGRLELPDWVPPATGETSCGTVGIWLFPDRSPVLWLRPSCGPSATG